MYPRGGGDDDYQLSWRVMMLSELGYESLFKRFKFTEAWDSPHNKLLLDYIPPEFQSPERFDSKTNYLAIAGNGMVFSGKNGTRLNSITDSLQNTLAIVEVDDAHAVEWTRPVDLNAVVEMPFDKLGGIRGEGAFGVMSDGRVVLLPKLMSPSRLAAFFTIAGGEPISASAFLLPPTAEPPPPALATVANDPEVANRPESPLMTPAGTPMAAQPSEVAKILGVAKTISSGDLKAEVPTEESLAKARELLKELFGKEFATARSIEMRRAFAKRMLDKAKEVEQSTADYHEVIRVAREIAEGSGDVVTSLAAADLFAQRFEVDPLLNSLAVLEKLSAQAKVLDAPEKAQQEALRLAEQAFGADRYDVAIPAEEFALSFARMQSKTGKAELSKLNLQIDTLEACKTLYTNAQKAFEKLQSDPADSASSEAVGRYLCFVKNRWDAGLPYLAKAADIRLRGLASLELSADKTAQQMISLADQYWDLGTQFRQPQRRGLQLRAVSYYVKVEPLLGNNLEKSRVQRRREEAAALYGGTEVNRVMAAMK